MKQGAVFVFVVLLAGLAWWLSREEPVWERPSVPLEAARTSAPETVRSPRHADPYGLAPQPVTSAKVVKDAAKKHGALSGRVVSWTTGAPVPNAEISFSFGGAVSSVTADAAGRFEYSPAQDGSYTLAVVSADGYFPYAPELGQSAIRFETQAGVRIDDITLYLSPAIDRIGTVLLPDTTPAAGAKVRLFGAADGELALMALADHFVANERGEFHFAAPENALFEATAAGFAPGRARFTRRVALVITLGTGTAVAQGTISGRVIDDAGEPVASASIVAATLADEATRPAATSGADGSFVLREVDPGKYRVTAADAEHAPATVEAEAGASGLVLKLQKGGEISGRVVSASTQQPIAAASVALLAQERPLFKTTIKTVSVLDASGRYKLTGIAPGTYFLVASAAGYAPSAEKAVSPGATEDIALERGGSLTGFVKERGNEKPIKDARVSLASDVPDGASPLPFVQSVNSDDNGQFVFTGLPRGRQSIEVVAESHHSRMVGGIDVGEGLQPALTVLLTKTKEGEAPKLEVAGIGCAVSAENDALAITAVLPGSGAERAKLVVGDRIVSVDGVPVVQLGMNEAIQQLRGQEGTFVQVTLKRAAGVTETVSVERIPVTF